MMCKTRCRLALAMGLMAILLACISPALGLEAIPDGLPEALGTDELVRNLPEDAARAVEGLSPWDTEGGLEKGFSNLMGLVSRLSGTFLGDGLRVALSMALIAALSAAVVSLFEGVPVQYVQIAAVLALAALAVTGTQSLVSQSQEALDQLDIYSKSLLPCMAAAAAASGQPAAAVLRQAATVFASDMLITAIENLLLPLLYVYAALLTLNAALPQNILKRIAGLIQWLVMGLLGLGLTGFTLYLTIGGVISGQADQLAVKGTKAALSGAVPVVGGIIADASEAVVTGAGVIKNAVGVFGLFAVLGILLSPLLTLGMQYLVFKLGAALCGMVGDESLAAYADGLGRLYAMLLALVGSAGFLMLISIVSCIMTST